MIGTQISHFRIIAKVGEGGMGVVYQAEDLDLGRVVALKVLPPHLVGDEDRRDRFVAEARTAAAATHPNIATIHEIGEADGIIYIAMEFVEGRTVRSLIDAGRLTLKETLRLATEIAEGLAAAHRARIAHRDLKPDNICVGHDGHVKILDFGLARLLERGRAEKSIPGGAAPAAAGNGRGGRDAVAEPADVPTDKAVTIPIGDQKVLGTPAYMSPEQARGLDVDFRTDLFSFGCTLYEMLTGRPPFSGPTLTSTLSDIINKEPIPATTLNPELPSSVQWILDKCLEKEPDRRYQDTRDLVVDLRHLFPEGTQTRTLEVGGWQRTSGPQDVARRRARGRRIAVAVGLVAVLGAAGVLLWRGQKLTAPPAEANSLAVFAFDNLKDPQDPQRLGQILQELLITDLSDLEPLKVFSSQRLSDVKRQVEHRLRQRGKAAAGENIATAVATQAGAQSMITGSLSQLGDRWILTAQLSEVASGTVLRSKRIDGADLYALVDQLTGEIQQEFAIQAPSEVADRPLKHKTSTSMEAWRHYLGGVDHMNNSQFNEAVQEITTAVVIDTLFGQAYYQLGLATWWLYSDMGAGRDHLVHLLEHKLYASKKEKEMAEGMLLLVDFKMSEALPVLQKLTQSYSDEKYAWYALGEANFHFPGASKQHESLEYFRRAVALDPDFLLPYWHIFDVLWDEERFDEALALAKELLGRDPDNPLFHRYRAATVALTGDLDGTEKAVAEALRHCRSAEDQRELYKLVAVSWGRLEYMNMAEQYAEKALVVDPQHDDPLIQKRLMEFLLAQRKYDEFETRARELLQQEPNNDLYRADVVEALLMKHEFPAARDLARQLAVQHPSTPRWYWYWTRAAILAGDETDVPAVIAAALQHATAADDRRNLYGSAAGAYSRCGNFNKAKEYALKAMQADPEREYAQDYLKIGMLDLARGQHEDAERWFRRSMQVAPKSPGGAVHMALLEVERGRVQEAMRWCDEAMKLLPPSKLFPFYSASLNILTGNPAAVGKLLTSDRTALAAEYQKWDVLYNEPGELPLGIGWAYLLAGDPREAQVTFEHAMNHKLNSRDPVAYKGLGWTYLAQGDYARAEQAFQAGLRVGYGHGDLLRGIGVAELLQGNATGAESYARRALTEDFPSVDDWRLLGFALAAQDRHREALAVAERAAVMDSSRTSFELLAWVLIDGDLDLERGIQVAMQAEQLPRSFLDVEKDLPHRVCAEHSLGHAYLKQGKSGQALQELQKANTLQPNGCIRNDLQRAQSPPSGT